MMESIISDYLHDNKRLVLPELGAFLRKDDGSVVFVPFLNKDDGVLASLVRQNYGVGQSEASSMVLQYVSSVRHEIETNGRYVVGTWGVMRRDVNGIVYLDPDVERRVEPVGEPIVAQKIEQVRVVAEVPVVEKRKVVDLPLVAEPRISVNREVVDRDVVREEPVREEARVRIEEPVVVPKRRADMVMIIAIIAAVVAILAMAYGYFTEDLPVFNLGAPVEQTPVK